MAAVTCVDMPSKKQRRRREKSFRHDYVWTDDEGHEAERLVELKPDAKKERAPKAQPAATARGRGGRPGRTIEPPSWRRVVKRGAIFAPLMFVAVSLLDSGRTGVGLVGHLLQTITLIAFFLPFSYVMDSVAYRMYLRRTGQAPAPRKDRQARSSPR